MSPTAGFGRHAAVYRWLLWAYPADYRAEVGDAAEVTFRDLCRRAAAEAGATGLTRLWLRTAPRVVAGGMAERLSALARSLASDPTAGTDPPPHGWACGAGAVVFGLYCVTLAPTTAFWDASEYIATAHILGIPHPPGNPLFVILARTWELLTAPLGLSVAVRINLFSAFMSAAAHGLWFLVVYSILGSFGRQRAFRLVGAAVAVLVSATAFTVWSQSNVNEKVYTVALFTIALISWLSLRWRARADDAGSGRILVLIAFVLALSVGNHLMAFLAAPALAVFVALVRPRVLLDGRLYAALAIAAMAGLSVHLFLPIRAALDPVINQGAPLCDSIGSALASILTYGRGGCEALGEALNREQYQKPSVLDRQAPLGAQVLHYYQYFDWQWSRGLDGAQTLLSPLRMPFTALFAGLGVWGALEHRRRQHATFWYFLALFTTTSAALVYYMNFEYGFTIPAPGEAAVGREVRERDYFFLVSFSLWGLWAGMGLAAAWQALAVRSGRGLRSASPVLLIACIPLVLNARWADRSEDFAARDYAYNLLQSVEPYGVLFTAGDNDTFPLWYLQEVEGVRRDVQVIVTAYLNVPWYAKQVRDLTRPCDGAPPPLGTTRITCQREYLPDSAVAYVGTTTARVRSAVTVEARARPPTLPIMQLDDDTIERIGSTWVPIEGPVRLRVGSIEPILAGAELAGSHFVEPWHQYALAIVDTAFTDDRPVYWTSHAGDPAELGLEPYLYRQGLAFRLHDGDLAAEAPEGVRALPEESPLVYGTGRWLDVPRTKRLMSEVFVHRSGLPDWDHWPDVSTRGIPYYYGWAYYALALAEASGGDRSASDAYARLGNAWMELVE